MKSGPKERPVVARFWSRIEKMEDGCWRVGGSKYGNEYAQLSLGKGKGTVTAHRFSYELHHGPIPLGLYVCHRCDVKNCVNPDHLYAGTHEDNTQDNIDRGRFKLTKVRPLKTRRLVRQKNRCLHSDERRRMIEEYESGKFTQTELAKRYGMSQGAVSANIRSWPDRKEDGGKKRSGHFRRKISAECALQIVELYATGKCTQTELAEKFGVTQTHVSRLVQKATNLE